MSSTERPAAGHEGNSADTTADRTRRTPSTDMQAEDAGTAASGNDSTRRSDAGRGAAAEAGMKQGHKTAGETSRRR